MTDMVLVPREPTREMIEAGEAERRAHPTNTNPSRGWTAMLSAALSTTPAKEVTTP